MSANESLFPVDDNEVTTVPAEDTIESLFEGAPTEGEPEHPELPDDKLDTLIDKPDETRETEQTKDSTETETQSTGQEGLLEDESAFVEPWIEAFQERYGWEIPDTDKPKNLEGMLDFIEEVVKTSSVPKYASEESAQFDEYIRNGGDKDKFFETYNKIIDIENADLTDQENQKVILTEYLKEKGLSERMIQSQIEQSIKTDTLEEQSKIAAEELSEFYKEQKASLVEQQAQAELKRQSDMDAFVQDIRSTVSNIDVLFGVELSRQDKEKLIPYVFQVQPNGKTQQQIDYENDPVGYTIMTAYSYMMKDKLMKKVEAQAKKTEVSKLQAKLSDLHRKRIKSDIVPDLSQDDMLDQFQIK